jgi:predicted alpha/beta superfamily hydrolase
MQDGQDLFDEFTSGNGEWGVDETLDSLIAKGRPACIVVGIDSYPGRWNEYDPYDNEKLGRGEGEQYLDFLVHTLKPYIDNHYSTFSAKENTIIAGSNRGALVAYYAMLRYPGVFGKGGIFFPEIGMAPAISALTDSLAKNMTGKFFFYMGLDNGNIKPDRYTALIETLGVNSNSMIYSVTDPSGLNNAKGCRKWFAEFYNWIMAEGFNYVVKIEE